MLNFTWATSYRAPVEAMPTPTRVPASLAIRGPTPLSAGLGAVNRRLPPARGQRITYWRKTELDDAQRSIDRSMRYAMGGLQGQQGQRVFHAAGIARCERKAKSTDTNMDVAERGQTSGTVSPGEMTPPELASTPAAMFETSFVNTVVAPGLLLIGPPPAYSWSVRYNSLPANGYRDKDEAEFERIRTTYGVPAYELLGAIAKGTQLHENFLYVGNAIRAFAIGMSTPARQTLNKSGEFFDVLAALNATLAGKHRLTSLTLAILQVMYHDAVDSAEAQMVDEALQSVIALQRAQLTLQSINETSVVRETTLPDDDNATTRTAPPSVSPRHITVAPTRSIALANFSEPDATSTHVTPTIAARQISCGDSVERAGSASLSKEGLARLIWLDGVPLIWAPDAALTFAWRPLPLAPYAVQTELQIEVPANASMCSSHEGRTYIQIVNRTFRVEETRFGTLWVIGPEELSLPPLPLLKQHDGWHFALPDDETNGGDVEHRTISREMPVPSEDGFVRWRNQKLICYGDQLRPVDASYIHGEESIRALAISVMGRLDQPDTEGILWGPDGRRLIEGQYGYYPLLEGLPRIGSQGSMYRIAFQGRASMAEVSFDPTHQRWQVLGAQRLDPWFSNVLDPANDIRVAHRLLSAGLALRLHASGQGLDDAPFLQTRPALREALRMSCAGLVTRILRFQSSPSTWSQDEQERLRTVWSALTGLLPAPVHWQQLPLLDRQLLLAENVALFYDQFAPSFPLNGVLHQMQMTALGLDALDGTLPENVLVQIKVQLISTDGLLSDAPDMLLYVDSPSLLTSFLYPSSQGAEMKADASWHRVPFATWLYDNRASVALINFSARGGFCSFESASDAAQVADAVDLFLWDRPSSDGVSFLVSPRDLDVSSDVSHA